MSKIKNETTNMLTLRGIMESIPGLWPHEVRKLNDILDCVLDEAFMMGEIAGIRECSAIMKQENPNV